VSPKIESPAETGLSIQFNQETSTSRTAAALLVGLVRLIARTAGLILLLIGLFAAAAELTRRLLRLIFSLIVILIHVVAHVMLPPLWPCISREQVPCRSAKRGEAPQRNSMQQFAVKKLLSMGGLHDRVLSFDPFPA
jgi:hypothetical protein